MFRLAAFALALALLAAGCSRREDPVVPGDGHVFEGVRMAAVYAALAEKPDAVRVLLIGDGAKALKNCFAAAGAICSETIDGKADIAVVDCARMGDGACERLKRLVSDNGVVAWIMDVNGLSAGEFRSRLDGFKFPEAHLWMPGENLWMVIARKRPRSVKLDSVLEHFSRESAFAGFAKYGVDSPAAVFAGYVGTVAEIRPAFSRGDLSATVRPEFFISRDASGIGWLSAETMDADVSARVLSSITDAREIRRMVVEGAMKAAAGDENGAVEMWAQAEEWMGGDVFLRERLDRLERNAKGFLAVKKVLMAMKCYETMLRIRPGDAAAAYKFGMCLREIGKLDLAERVLERARELMRDGGSGGGSAGRE